MKVIVRALAALVLPAVTALSAVPAASGASPARAPRVVMLGRSVDARAIRAVEVGDPAGMRVLVVGCVHGTECAGIQIARRLERAAPRGVDLWIVPDLNPDGHAARSRTNAHGVDLNRNFPWRWRPMDGTYESGPHPLSEPESRIAYRLILRLRPHISIWFHQHLNMIWASGGNRAIERRFAQLSGLPYHPMPPLAGTAISWQNHALPETTAFAAELPAGRPGNATTSRYVHAVLTVAQDVARSQKTGPRAHPDSVGRQEISIGARRYGRHPSNSISRRPRSNAAGPHQQAIPDSPGRRGEHPFSARRPSH